MGNFDFTSGAARIDLEAVDPLDLERREAARSLVRDERRVRPLYHDGRFLTAADLTREQLYVLTRQADLAAARQGGVLRGLEVRRLGTSLQVSAGAGFTPDGELVTLPRALSVDAADIPEADRIDLSFGTVDVPEPPARDRSGLYVLGVRPLEYARRVTTRYPLTTHGAAGLELGDLVESAALTLQPFRFDGARDPGLLRSEVARSVFLERAGVLASDVLALALLLLQGGLVRWIDTYLVRRDIAADAAAPLGIVESPRSHREAHFQQFDRQLGELVTELGPRNQLRFPAARYFRCLPPVGRLPAAAIDPATFTQAFFPPAMTVELSAVVDTELPALYEDALHLPPIDLMGSDDDFDHTLVHVLVPMRADELDALRLAAVVAPKLLLLPAVLARRAPLLALQDLIAKRHRDPTDLVDETRPEPAPLLAAWRQALSGPADRMLWFVRVPAVACASVELFDELDTDEDGIPDTKEIADAKPDTDAKNATDAAAKNATDAKNTQDTKTATDTKNSDDTAKSQQDAKNELDAKGTQDAKSEQDAKNSTDTKREQDSKRETDAKNETDAVRKAERDAKRDADTQKDDVDAKNTRDVLKDRRDAKADRDAKREEDSKLQTDTKELRDGNKLRDIDKLAREDDKLREIAKLPDVEKLREIDKLQPETNVLDLLREATGPAAVTPSVLSQPEGPSEPVRTFIRADERPDLDAHVVTKPRES